MRRTWFVCLAAGLVAAWAAGQERKVSDAEVRKVHRSAILIDTHNDVTSRTVEGLDIGKRSTETHTDLVRMKEGGMTATFFAAYVGATYVEGNRSVHRALAMIDTIKRDIVEKHPHEIVLATTADEIARAKKRGKLAALIGVEGGHALEDDLRVLRTFYDLGARYMTLTHTNTNGWADSSGDENREGVKRNGGLNELGRKVIAEMNRLGMMVDIAHVSDATFTATLEASRAPIFSSHSSCRALSNIGRNLSDDMIRALAKKGGVVQINFGCEFLSQKSADSSPFGNPKLAAELQKKVASIADPRERRAAMRKLFDEMDLKVARATLDDVVAHIDHIKKLAGVDYVGLGSDFDGVSCTPEGLDDVSKWPNLTRRLLERGYAAAEIRKIYGGNVLRVMREVEQTAARMRSGQ